MPSDMGRARELMNGPAQTDDSAPAADLLTQAETVRLLRLDQLGLKDPSETLRYLRRTRQLGYVKVAGKILIPRKAIEAYLQKHEVPACE